MELTAMEGRDDITRSSITSTVISPELRTEISLANYQGLLRWHERRLNGAHSIALKAYGRIVLATVLIPLLTIVFGYPVTWLHPETYTLVHDQYLPAALVAWLTVALVCGPLWVYYRHYHRVIKPLRAEIAEAKAAIKLLHLRKLNE